MTPTEQRDAAIDACAKIEMDREGHPLSRTQEEIHADAAEMVDAILAASGSAEPQLLSPDAEDVRLLRDGALPRCPCCTGTPTTFARFFPHSGIYQAYVHCSHCDVQVFKNARVLDAARELAIATWSKRPQ